MGCCADCNEPSGSIKCGEFLDFAEELSASVQGISYLFASDVRSVGGCFPDRVKISWIFQASASMYLRH